MEGYLRPGICDGAQDYFKEAIDEVVVYYKALSALQAQSHYATAH